MGAVPGYIDIGSEDKFPRKVREDEQRLWRVPEVAESTVKLTSINNKIDNENEWWKFLRGVSQNKVVQDATILQR